MATSLQKWALSNDLKCVVAKIFPGASPRTPIFPRFARIWYQYPRIWISSEVASPLGLILGGLFFAWWLIWTQAEHITNKSYIFPLLTASVLWKEKGAKMNIIIFRKFRGLGPPWKTSATTPLFILNSTCWVRQNVSWKSESTPVNLQVWTWLHRLKGVDSSYFIQPS